MATFAECEAEWLSPPEDQGYDFWVDRVLDELKEFEPPVTDPSDALLNESYELQIGSGRLNPEWGAQRIHLALFPQLYGENEDDCKDDSA